MAFDYDDYGKMEFLILFILSLFFIIFPLISNLIQLHIEISKWINDRLILANTGVKLWIKSKVTFLYLLSILSGSSFSCISLVNSNLFQLSIFSMGLSRYHILYVYF